MSNDPRTPIDAAIDTVERRQMEAELARLEPREPARVPILTTPHRWSGEEEIVIDAMPDDHPTLLLWDAAQGGWRVAILPAGSKWRIIPDRAGLWRPGMPT